MKGKKREWEGGRKGERKERRKAREEGRNLSEEARDVDNPRCQDSIIPSFGGMEINDL